MVSMSQIQLTFQTRHDVLFLNNRILYLVLVSGAHVTNLHE